MGRERARGLEWSPEGQIQNFAAKIWSGQRGHRKVGRGWYSWKPVKDSLSEIQKKRWVRAAKKSQKNSFEGRLQAQHPATCLAQKQHSRFVEGGNLGI